MCCSPRGHKEADMTEQLNNKAQRERKAVANLIFRKKHRLSRAFLDRAFRSMCKQLCPTDQETHSPPNARRCSGGPGPAPLGQDAGQDRDPPRSPLCCPLTPSLS